MKILACFKLCPDLDKLRPEDLQLGENMSIDTHFLPNIINCFDESGLEFGIRLSEQSESLAQHIEKTAFTAGGDAVELTLKTLKALGYDHVVRAKAEESEIRYKPDNAASAIADYCSEHPQDVIIMGREAPLGNNCAVPQLVSALTGFPIVSSVTDITYVDSETLKIKILNNGALYEQTVTVPVILSVGNAVVSSLRVPTLRARMKCKNCETEYFETKNCPNPIFTTPFNAKLPDRKRKGYLSTEKGDAAVKDIFKKSLNERLNML